MLLRSLQAHYADILRRLTRRVGPDVASDALNETWLRLERQNSPLAEVKNPDAYVYRAALNTAANMRKADTRLLTFVDIEDLLAVPDDAPGPAAIAADRASIDIVRRALSDLTERQQAVFYETFLGDVSHQVLADRYGVTVRTIQKELKRAVEHCARRLGNKKSFASGQARLSGRYRY
ncbi:RNA polymerase sigma factor, sigma-70 family [Brevundimonas sp. BAL3]|nr:RNA polymerase sigma factor, sigma-70 family [Brevundimonas sp. BAL3]